MLFISYAPNSNSTPERTLRCKPQNRIVDHSVLIVGYTQQNGLLETIGVKIGVSVVMGISLEILLKIVVLESNCIHQEL